MSEFKGTKGTWKRVKLEGTEFYTARNEIHYGEDGECIAEFVHDDYDALLISKAPEILEFLIEHYQYLRLDHQEKAKQLIKQATE